MLLIIAIAALSGMSNDIYLPSLPEMASSLHASLHLVQTTITLYFLGLAFGQLIVGPASDRFGRRPVILTGLIIYILGLLPCIFSYNIYLIIFGRLLQSIGACCGIVTAYAVSRDLFEGVKSIQVMAKLTVALGFTGMIAPVVGGYLQAWFNWRANFIFLALFSGLLFLSVFFKLPETIKVRQLDGFSFKKSIKNYFKLLSNKNFITYNFSVAFAYATFVVFLITSPIYFINHLHLNTKQFGFIFTSVAAVYMLGGIIVQRYAAKFSKEILVNAGIIILLFGSVLLTVLAKLISASVISFLLPYLIMILGLSLIYAVGIAAAMQSVPEIAGTAAALLNFSRFSISSMMGFIVSYLGIYRQFGVGLVMIILVFLTIGIRVIARRQFHL